MSGGSSAGRGLLVDYGGVLTASLGPSFRAFERTHELPSGTVLRMLAEAYERDAEHNPIARYERGQTSPEDFESALAGLFAGIGFEVPAADIKTRLFGELTPEGRVWDLVAQAHGAGVHTGLLSNSWGTEGYPREKIAAHFDTVVISGEVGLRKPDPRIFRLAADRLGLPVEACVFVDDLDLNVEAAEAIGMKGVVHRDDQSTASALSALLDLDLCVG